MQRPPAPPVQQHQEIERLKESILSLGARELPFTRLYLLERKRNSVEVLTPENAVWAAHYEREYGPLYDKAYAKVQYMAAWLEAKADEMRPDVAQLYYRQLMSLLMIYQETGWAKYRIAKLINEGKGTHKGHDREVFEWLEESIAQGDFRAAAYYYFEASGSQNDKLDTVIYEMAAKMFDMKCGRGATIIGYFSENHSIENAMSWYILALLTSIPDPLALTHLIRLIRETCDSRYDARAQWLESLAASLTAASHRALRAEIYYQCAFEYGMFQDRKREQQAYQRAAEEGHIKANIYLLEQSISAWVEADKETDAMIEAVRNRLTALKELSRHDHEAAWHYVNGCICIDGYYAPDIQQSFDALKALFRAGYHAIAYGMGRYLLGANVENWRNNLDELGANPENVWWIQHSLLFADHQRYVHFLHYVEDRLEKNRLHPYYACVIGIIKMIGAPGTTMSESSDAEASRYFQGMLKAHREKLIHYLHVGKQEGFLAPEIELELKKLPVLQPVFEALQQREMQTGNKRRR